jgi:hypothetical protein
VVTLLFGTGMENGDISIIQEKLFGGRMIEQRI